MNGRLFINFISSSYISVKLLFSNLYNINLVMQSGCIDVESIVILYIPPTC